MQEAMGKRISLYGQQWAISRRLYLNNKAIMDWECGLSGRELAS
jgi:hypothetical protein